MRDLLLFFMARVNDDKLGFSAGSRPVRPIFRGAEPRIVMIYSKNAPICGSSRLIRIK